MGSVSINVKPNWGDDISSKLRLGLLEMATDIHRRSAILAPKDTRALVNSGTITPTPSGYSIIYGSSRVPYALIRHEVNKKNPGSLRYLEKGAESVVRGAKSKYFKDK